MLFNSLDFLFFFSFVYALYLRLPHRGQNLLLLASSYFFYGAWDYRFLSLLFLSTAVDYVLARAIEDSPSPRRRRRLLVISMCVSLGVLGFFKYCNFFIENLQALLAAFGLDAAGWHLDIILPWGISFYTFQTMSYTIDVYRGHMKACRQFGDFAVFVSFWPHLVAGPIMRANLLLPQVQTPRVITYEMVREGTWLILFGLYKKVVVADNLAPFANALFDDPAGFQGLAVLGGLLAFAFQIYGDFSGYSDIARGTARLMGFDLMVNFRMPYFATNPSDFWRRWHISLSTWLRDYLYISLGGNRAGRARTYLNLTITMLLGGLWHGAAWHFIAWGAYHGLLLVAHRLVAGDAPPARAPTPARRLLHMAGFFTLTLFGWLLFRVHALSDVPLLLAQLFHFGPLTGKVALLSVLCFAGPLLLIEMAQERAGDLLVVKRWPPLARAALYAALLAALLLCGAVDKHEFIYFQF